MNGRFQGTFQVDGGDGIGTRVAAGIGAGVAVVAVIAAFAWLIAIAVAVIALVLLGAALWLRRRPAADDEAFAQQAERLRASVKPQVTHPQSPVAIVTNYYGGNHVHLNPGADTAGIIRKTITGQAGDATPEKGTDI